MNHTILKILAGILFIPVFVVALALEIIRIVLTIVGVALMFIPMGLLFWISIYTNPDGLERLRIVGKTYRKAKAEAKAAVKKWLLETLL